MLNSLTHFQYSFKLVDFNNRVHFIRLNWLLDKLYNVVNPLETKMELVGLLNAKGRAEIWEL